MSDSNRKHDAAEPEPLEDELERARRLILERRNRFMAAAIAGLGMASGGCAPSVCLSFSVDPPFDAGSGGTDATVPCTPGAQECEADDGGVEEGEQS